LVDLVVSGSDLLLREVTFPLGGSVTPMAAAGVRPAVALIYRSSEQAAAE